MTSVRATVTRVQALGARMRRIELAVPHVARLGLPRVGDAAVGVYLPAAGDRHALDPEAGSDGRNYTVRFHDDEALTIDVVLHAHGPGTDWARRAVPGDSVVLDHARSWYAPGPETDWQVLVADLAGLPALARILAEAPDHADVVAIAEVLDETDLDYLAAPPHVKLVPAMGSGNGGRPSRMAESVVALNLPAGRGYCWFAGEAAESRAVRKHLRSRGFTTDQFDVVGYWRQDSEAWDRRFARVSDELVAVYTTALADGKSEKVASEEFDEALEEAGL